MIYTEKDRLEAANWFLDIHDVEAPSPEMLREWVRWMEDSEAHRLAFAAVESAWYAAPANADPTADSNRSDDDEYDGTISIHEWRARQRKQPCAINDSSSARVWRRPRWASLAAAAGVGAIALVVLLKWHGLSSRAGAVAEFATHVGEHMQVTLADGSQVNLGARSRLLVAYTPTGRDVRLEAGEGFFSVQKDPSRPFRVNVLNGVVTAVGTAFDVRTANDRIVVAVAEGTVQVTGSEATSDPKTAVSLATPHLKPRTSETTRITRGESISFISHVDGQSLVHSSISRIDPGQPARWRDGWLVYRDEPLRDVLADIGRYTDRELIIEEGVPAAPHFTGAVFKDSVQEWLESLPNAFPVTIRTSGARITIAPASGSVLSRAK
jgi:transmembrane sensor